jgi:hypothetical protein
MRAGLAALAIGLLLAGCAPQSGEGRLQLFPADSPAVKSYAGLQAPQMTDPTPL